MKTKPPILFALSIAALLVATVWFRLLQNTAVQSVDSWQERDAIQYFCADQIFTKNGNPYLPDEMLACQQASGRLGGSPVMMWTHPSAALFFRFFQSLSTSHREAFFYWSLAMGASFVASVGIGLTFMRTKSTPFSREMLILASFYGATFPAFPSAIYFSQISPLLCLVVSISLSLVLQERFLSAGILAALLIIKPQFIIYLPLILFTFYFLYESARQSVVKFSAGLLLGLALLGISCEFFYPSGQWLWLQSFLSPPEESGAAVVGRNQWATASLIGVFGKFSNMPWGLSLVVGIFLSSVFLVITAAMFNKKGTDLSEKENAIPLVLALFPWFVSLSPYVWLYDKVLLLPFVFLALSNSQTRKNQGFFLAGMLAIHGIALYQQTLSGSVQADYAWLGFAYSGCLLFLSFQGEKNSGPREH